MNADARTHRNDPGATAQVGRQRVPQNELPRESPSEPPGEPQRLPQVLPALLAEIGEARRDLASARCRHVSLPALAEQRRLYDALDAYAQALTALGLPVPHRIRSDLLMYGALLAARRG